MPNLTFTIANVNDILSLAYAQAQGYRIELQGADGYALIQAPEDGVDHTLFDFRCDCEDAIRLDEAFERRWSFRVVSYQVRRREVLVLGELSAAGEVRQQFGAAKTGLNIGKSARAAALDAMVKCARLFGVDARERQREASPPPSPLRQRSQPGPNRDRAAARGRKAFREVLRQFQVRRSEQIPEEALPDVLSRCEEVYRVPLPSSTNGRSAHA